MTKNLDKMGLKTIADSYELFYIDLWGVVHNGVNLHDEAINVLFGKWSGTEVKIDGKEYSIMKESDIMGISSK